MKKSVNQKIDSLKSRWYLWLFPMFALILAGWLTYDYYQQRGPTIKIFFNDASSIQSEKTSVRFRGVTIGMVKRITLSEDNKDVIAYVTLQRDARQFAVEGSKFWVVKPQIDMGGISGLETIFEGTYISASPGKQDGPEKLNFDGQIGGESVQSAEDTVPYYLETANVESVSEGDSVTFRGLKVGSVAKITLSKTAQVASVQINIESKYTRLIRNNTVFWRKVGIQAKLGLFNSEVKINSLDTLMRGGIDFFTPENAEEMAKSHAKFALSDGPPKGYEKWNPKLEF